MVRVIIKGGVWKNTEDEILKAAISKYGLNQWARISSLLVRKTPKQCKARWYEWLDPAIKKTEWSKEEDEKLLHLAKLMPTQWRTIAPVVGRTANQCLERYQKLLDEAEAQENQASGSSLALTGTGETVPSADDVRRLRPGEIDPDPETKPARPDPIDMDEDEKEMLSEARARLANTQGKKAKRKARERALEEARRLAMLQKRRELKAAGILMKQKPKKDGMDYNADIPFEKKPMLGFYDTSEEASKAYKAPVGKTLKALDSRGAAEDDAQKKKRQREAEEKSKQTKLSLSHSNEEQIRKLKEAEQISKRRRLNLPAAQVGEGELEEIVKLGQAGERARSLVEDGSNDATGGLLGDYSTLDSVKTARTPQTAPNGDHVMREARNLRLMSTAQTPLLGDANVDLLDSDQASTSSIGGRTVSQTPNPLLTPLRPDTVAAESRSGAPGSTPMRTPLRDNLGINRDDSARSVSSTPRELRHARSAAQQQLKLGLSSLPAPKNDFDIVVEDDDTDDLAEVPEASSSTLVEDSAQRDAKLAQRREEEARKALERRSEVVKRHLPRPAVVELDSLLGFVRGNKAAQLGDSVQQLIAHEMILLMHHDATIHPIPGSQHPDPASVRLGTLSDDSLAEARKLIHAELASQIGFPGASQEALKQFVGAALRDDEVAIESFESSLQEQWRKSRNNKNLLTASLEDARSKMAGLASTAAKGEKILAKVLGGYQARSKALGQSIREQFAALEEGDISRRTFERLQHEEQGGKAERVASLRREVDRLESREGMAQTRYKSLEEEKAQLTEDCEMLQVQLDMRKAEALNEAALADE